MDNAKNMKYQKKWQKMKQLLKEFVFENAALCDEIACIQEKQIVIREENKFLLRRCRRLQSSMEQECDTLALQYSQIPMQKLSSKPPELRFRNNCGRGSNSCEVFDTSGNAKRKVKHAKQNNESYSRGNFVPVLPAFTNNKTSLVNKEENNVNLPSSKQEEYVLRVEDCLAMNGEFYEPVRKHSKPSNLISGALTNTEMNLFHW
ncbi:Uncharacterized protein GBIM_03619 [Gryllus bimaculatus]|nr:Uncharacterized protein GBIM_03619 [Gryllus bimaculatus]